MKSVSRWTSGLLIAGGALACASAPAAPASPSSPKTRADVRADLVEWRSAGFDQPDWINYPENAQQAGAVVTQRRAAAAGAARPAPVHP